MTILVIDTSLMRHMKAGNSLTSAPLCFLLYLTQGSYNVVPCYWDCCTVTVNLAGYQRPKSTVCDNVSKYRQVTPTMTGNSML